MGNMTVHLEETLKKAEEVLKGGKEYVLENPDDAIEQIYWLRYNAEMLKLMLSEEKGYRDWVQKNRIKGYCCGYLTRQAGSQMIAHQTAEKYEQEKIELRKLANNPILSEAAKKTLRRALWMVNLGLWEHNQLCRIREGEKDAVKTYGKLYFVSADSVAKDREAVDRKIKDDILRVLMGEGVLEIHSEEVIPGIEVRYGWKLNGVPIKAKEKAGD